MTDQAEGTGAEIITIPHKASVPDLFKRKDGIANLVTEIEKQARSYVSDISTPKGRKDVKSLAAKVSRSKTLIDEVRKEQNEEAQNIIKGNNAIGKAATERLDALRDEIKKPVTEWEDKEAERVRQHLLRMDEFDQGRVDAHSDTATITGIIEHVKAVEVDASWEEYEADANTAKAAALAKWDADLSIAKAREDQAKELEELRALNAKREAEDAEREKQAAIKAEEEAKAETFKAEQERITAEARAKAEREAQERIAAAEAVAEAAKAEQEAAAARAAEQEQRHTERLAAAKLEAEQAAEAERAKQAKEKADEAEALAKRAADKKHRQKIRGEIVKAIAKLKPESVEEIVDAMMSGEIAHVEVKL